MIIDYSQINTLTHREHSGVVWLQAQKPNSRQDQNDTSFEQLKQSLKSSRLFVQV